METTARSGHLMGLKPLVLVTFQSPVNFYRWEIEYLEIQMVAIPFLSKALLHSIPTVQGCAVKATVVHYGPHARAHPGWHP